MSFAASGGWWRRPSLVYYDMQAPEELWHYCHTCRLVWIMAW
jgi:aspartyl/asparaginyl beta-hydroxylase (cupin superfamily)